MGLTTTKNRCINNNKNNVLIKYRVNRLIISYCKNNSININSNNSNNSNSSININSNNSINSSCYILKAIIISRSQNSNNNYNNNNNNNNNYNNNYNPKVNNNNNNIYVNLNRLFNKRITISQSPLSKYIKLTKSQTYNNLITNKQLVSNNNNSNNNNSNCH